MAVIDWVQAAGTTHTPGSSASYDGNWNTYYGGSQSGGGGNLDCNYTSQHDFASPVTLSQIKFKLYSKAKTDDYSSSPNVGCSAGVSIYYSAAWHGIPGGVNCSGKPGIECTCDTGTHTENDTWINVESIKATVSSACGADHNTFVWCYIYEIQAWGPPLGGGFAYIL